MLVAESGINIVEQTYRVDDPRCTIPGGRVNSRPEVEEHNSSDTTASQMVLWIFGRVDDVDVCAQNPHADGACDTTDQKQLASTKLINQEQKPDESHDGFDDAKDTRHYVDCITLNTNALPKVSVVDLERIGDTRTEKTVGE